jgi:tetratricopeptide (TPR) repeat protein
LYKQQLQIYGRQASNQRPVDTVLGELVRLAILQGDYIEAEQFLRRRLTIANEGNARGQVDILLELAALYQRIGDLRQADSRCQQALEIAQSVGYRVAVVDALRQQASVNRSRGKLEDARKLCQAALDAALEMSDQFRAGQIQEQLTALETTLGKNIFISYSHHDRGFVKRLAHDLKAVGLTVWWDEWEIRVGDSIIEKISQGINGSAYLAVVLSPHSVKSNWVQRELGSALMRQLSVDRDITVLPLLISDCEVPVLIREIKWADFQQDYQAGLKELLTALITKGANG